ncbi:MAG TPA: sialidase family protein [Pyrinomonadaceae bacterium]|nr:sialidase family protein [Pyrinomonadaceae bacterium]
MFPHAFKKISDGVSPRRLLAAAVAPALLAALLGASARTAAAQSQPITFHNNTMADHSATSGEPIIKVDNRDRIFVTTPFGLSTTVSILWRSDDGGRTYLPLGPPILRDAVTGPGGGDSDVDFDDKGRVYFIDLSAACVTVAVSEDGGNTFPTDRTSYISCVSGQTMGAIDDRQWIVAQGDGRAYMTWRRFTGLSPLPFYMWRTRDAGRTWDQGRVLGNVSQSGPLKVDKTKRRVTVNGQERDAILVYQIYYNGNDVRMFRVTDLDDGSEPTVEDFRIYNGGSEDTSFVFPVLTVDRAGNLYAVWSQAQSTPGTSQSIWMATSTDRGATWSPRKRVSTFTGTNIMPWIVAGDAGRAAIIWYRSPLAGNPNTLASEWTIHMAQTLNAFDATPSFETVQVSQNIVHRGEICTDGTLCDAQGRDRSFLEYPSIDMDSKGAAVIVYNDNTNQSEGPYVMTAKQATGPSLLASVGNLGREPGAVAITTPAANQSAAGNTFTVSGTHTVPPKNYDRDEAGDAHFRSTDPNRPGADLRSVSVREEGSDLVVTMQVADLTTAAVNAAASSVANGEGMLYLTQWDYNDTIYWLGAEVRATGTSFYTGTLGMIRSATSKKFITYNPDLVKSQQVRGQMQAAAPGAITIRVPKAVVGSPAAGAQFHSLTAYALSERGPLVPVGADLPNAPFPAPKTTSVTPGPSGLPVQLDATGAVTYTVGAAGPASDGVVEVSVDDPTFSSPRTAAFSTDLGQARWEFALDLSQLASGSHTVYARQRINGRDYSPVVSAQFAIPDTVEADVTSLVGIETGNARFSAGAASFDLAIRNTSGETIFTPLSARVAQLSSYTGRVTVANADNSVTGAGALWNYAGLTGGDNALSPTERSGARNVRFNNPNGETFTVSFAVVGHLSRGTAGAQSAQSSGGTSSGAGSTGGTGGEGTQSTSPGGLTSLVYKVTFNPLLGTATVEVAPLTK